ncbi:MAG: TIGR03086 family metal-binding protein [Acidimicrobiales bacterium]
MAETRPDTLRMLDLAQTGAASVIAQMTEADFSRPTPCDQWSAMDIVNKMTASTIVFTSFGNREEPDPGLDLVNPKHIVGDDPLGSYLRAAEACRETWRTPGALDGMALSTIGEAKARAVLNARIFDTTILTWDLAAACDLVHPITDELATYVLRIAEALVPAVRAHNEARYKPPADLGPDAPLIDRLVAAAGRDPHWTP